MLPVITNFLPNLMLWFLILGALFLWWATKRKRHVRLLGWILILALWLLSTRPVAEAVLWPLESRYVVPTIASLIKQRLTQVVVLTGGGYPVRGDLLSSALPHASMYRFLNGLELCARLGPNCKIIFSGSAGRGNRGLTTALTMQELCLLLRPDSQVLAEGLSAAEGKLVVEAEDEPLRDVEGGERALLAEILPVLEPGETAQPVDIGARRVGVGDQF